MNQTDTNPEPAELPSRTRPQRTRRQLGVLQALLLFAAMSFLLLQEGAITNSDGASVVAVTAAIVEHRQLNVGPDHGIPGGDSSRYYSRYGLGLSLLATPIYLVVHPIARLTGHSPLLEQTAVASLMPLISAVLVGALYALVRTLGARPTASVVTAFGAIAGTFVLPYTKDFFGEPLTALLLVLAINDLLRKRPLRSSTWAAAAVLVRSQTILFMPALVWFLWRRHRISIALRATAILSSGLLLMFAYNFLRFHDPLLFGYQDTPGFANPLFKGTWDLITHPRKSVILFAPISLLLPTALLHTWKAHRDATILLIWNFVTTFILTATWWSWEGGWSWGPRLLIPGVVPILAALGPWAEGRPPRRVAVVACFTAGFLVSVSTLLVSTRAQQLDVPRPSLGPSIVRQAQLVPSTAEATIFEVSDWERGSGDYNRYVNTWQVAAVKEFGPISLALIVPVTLLLLTIWIVALRQLRTALTLPHTTLID